MRANGRTTREAGHSISVSIFAVQLFSSALASDLGHMLAVLAYLLSAFTADRCHVFAVAAHGFAAFACGFPTAVGGIACRSSLLCLLCHPKFPPGLSKLCGYAS